MASDDETLRERYVTDDAEIRWQPLGGRLSRGFVYTMFLAAIQVITVYITAVRDAVSDAITLGTSLLGRIDGAIFTVAADATVEGIGQLPAAFGFVIALVITFATMWVLATYLEVP
jgi:hypothetical protein